MFKRELTSTLHSTIPIPPYPAPMHTILSNKEQLMLVFPLNFVFFFLKENKHISAHVIGFPVLIN